jgi:hypothetical protein
VAAYGRVCSILPPLLSQSGLAVLARFCVKTGFRYSFFL